MNFLKLTLSLFLLLPMWAIGQEVDDDNEIPRTNLDHVFAGPDRRAVTALQLEPGLYQAQDKEGEEALYIIVQTFINDPDKRLILMLPQDVLKGKRVGHGWIFQSRQVRGGGALMLSPLSLDGATGNIVVDSENERYAPVVLLTKKSGTDHKNPYVLEGRNGGLEGKLMEMSKVKYHFVKPVMRSRPSRDIFVGICPNQSKLTVSSKFVSIHDDDAIDLSFRMLEVNGGHGELSALARSKFDSMSESDMTYEDVERFATFYSLGSLFGEWANDNDERFLMATPAGKKGYYLVEVYARAKEEKNILEKILDALTGDDE